MTTNDPNPEHLYRMYRQSRKSAGSAAAETSLPDHLSDKSLASHTYQKYKSTRGSTTHGPVDAIMSRIKEERGMHNVARSHLNTTEPSKFDGSDGSKHKIVSFFGGAGKKWSDMGSGEKKKLDLRTVAPAIAATFLAFLAIPMVFDLWQPRDAGSAGEAEHYRIAATLLEQKTAQNLGFSSGSIDEKNAFNVGLLAMQIKISAFGNQPDKLDFAKKKLSSLIGADDIGRLADSLAAENTMTSASLMASMNDAFQALVEDRTMQEMSEFRSIVKSNGTGTDSHRWFDLGEHIQAILLFAQMHAEFNITTPLHNEMENYKKMELPDQTLSVTRLLNELKNLAGISEYTDENVNDIISLCRDIKILMQ